jgi:hypothetical protein
MKISDLSYLQVVSESSVVGGEDGNIISAFQLTSTNINGNRQVTERSSGAPYTKEVIGDTTVYEFGGFVISLPTALV